MGDGDRQPVATKGDNSSSPIEELGSQSIDQDDRERANTTPKSHDRDVALEQLERDKRLALIKAWEENEKAKVDNKAYKKLSAIDSWEKTQRSSVGTQLRQIEERIEQKKVEYATKMKNKMALLHMAAEEKRALVEADRGKEFLLVEEAAAEFRATNDIPRRLFACFSC